jgi:GGDEF domain-containing protein
VLEDPQRFLVANLVVAACVAIPTATIASQHEFQLKRYQRQLESLASTDPLTGLLNRRFFRISAEDEMKRQRRTGGMAALVLFDLDQFKQRQ